MKVLNPFVILVRTYFTSVIINTIILFLFVMPFKNCGAGYFCADTIVIGILSSFFFPGLVSLFLFLPILVTDKKNGELSLTGLLKRHISLLILFTVIITGFIFLLGGMDVFTIYGCLCFYGENIMCLCVFCRTIIGERI